jgi:ABC-type cobalamin transport system ATPase subunit
VCLHQTGLDTWREQPPCFSTSFYDRTAPSYLEVNSTTRREDYQLSESQKFFVDIALRMALAHHMSRQSVCLFVDTPEGSLDIAYESRAGEMFARFVADGSSIIMTANINSSQLLRRLAAICKRERLHLCRMTNWTQLSAVQMQEEHQFEIAYAAIEQAMETMP